MVLWRGDIPMIGVLYEKFSIIINEFAVQQPLVQLLDENNVNCLLYTLKKKEPDSDNNQRNPKFY
jgi:hypothetical protein